MFALLNPRFLVALTLAALLAFTAFISYRKGAAHVQADWIASVASANTEALRLERARQSRVDESVRAAAAREDRLRSDAAGARRVAGGVRDDLDATKRYAAQSLAAANESVAALSDVFGQCVRAYSDMAETADRATSEALTLRQAWPKE